MTGIPSLGQLLGFQIELGVFIDEPFRREFAQMVSKSGDNLSQVAFISAILHNVELLLKPLQLNISITFHATLSGGDADWAGFGRHLEELPSDPDPDSHKSGHATPYLNAFCELQAAKKPHNWDHAILFSGCNLTFPVPVLHK